MTALVPITAFANWPLAVSSAAPDALHAILQFFAAEVRNPNTRRAYIHAAQNFFRHAAMMPAGHCLATLTSLHVSSWVEAMMAQGQKVRARDRRSVATARCTTQVAALPAQARRSIPAANRDSAARSATSVTAATSAGGAASTSGLPAGVRSGASTGACRMRISATAR